MTAIPTTPAIQAARRRSSQKQQLIMNPVTRAMAIVLLIALALPFLMVDAADLCQLECGLNCGGILECGTVTSIYCSCKIKQSFIIGVSCGGAAAVIACIACCCYCCRSRTVVVSAPMVVQMQGGAQVPYATQPMYAQPNVVYAAGSPGGQAYVPPNPNPYGSQPQPVYAQPNGAYGSQQPAYGQPAYGQPVAPAS